jgi:hypothetical protein
MKTLNDHEQSITSEVNAADNQAKIEALCRLIQHLRKLFAFALVEYDLPSRRDLLISEIRKGLPEMHILHVTLIPPSANAPPAFNALDQLEKLVKLYSPGKIPDAIIITHFETWFPDLSNENSEQTSEKLARVIQPLNLGRNLLAEGFPYPILLCLPSKQMATFLRSAPDLSSWRSGFYQFRSDEDKVRAEILKESRLNIAWRIRRRYLLFRQKISDTNPDMKNLQAQVKRFGTLIADAKELAVEGHILARLYERLGMMCIELDNLTRAREMFAEMQRFAGNNKWLARSARKRLRSVERITSHGPSLNPDALLIHKVFRGARVPAEEGELDGRQNEVNGLFTRLEDPRISFQIVHGENGCGKSSFIWAGLVPKLPKHKYIPVKVCRWNEPEANMRAALEKVSGIQFEANLSLRACIHKVADREKKTIMIICDQFEQFFNLTSQHSKRDAFLADVRRIISDKRFSCKFLFVISQDHLSKLTEFDKHLGDPLGQKTRFNLPTFSESDAINTLRRLSLEAGMNWDETDTFIPAIARDLAKDDRVYPLNLQLVASAVALSGITNELDYSRAGGGQGLRADYLDLVLDSLNNHSSLDSHSWYKEKMVRVLLALVDKKKRIRLSEVEIARRTYKLRKRLFVESVRIELELLIKGNLIHRVNEVRQEEVGAGEIDQSGVVRYELVHDELIKYLLQMHSQQRKAHKILRRALKESEANSGYAIGLRDWLFIRRNCSKDELKEPKVKALFWRSIRHILSKWTTRIVAAFLISTIIVQFNSAHIHLSADTDGRIIIHPGHPLLDFLPFIGSSASLDSGFSMDHFNFENRADGAFLFIWGFGKQLDHVLEENEFLDAIKPPILRGKVLCQIGQLEKGTAALLSAIDDPKSKEAAIEALAEVALAETSYARKLVARLQKEMGNTNPEITKKAMEALGWLMLADGNLSEAIFNSVKDQVKNTNDGVKILATILLRRIALAEPKLRESIIATLIPVARDTAPKVAQASAHALLQVARADSVSASAVRSQLLPVLKTFSMNTSRQFAEVIALAARAEPTMARQAYDEILSLIKNASSHYLPHEITDALITVVRLDTALIQNLIVEIQTDASPAVRVAAARVLGEIAREQPALANKIIDPMLAASDDHKAHVCDEAILAIAKITQANPGLSDKALQKLLLIWPQRKENRRAAAIALAEISQINNAMTAKVYDMLINSSGGLSVETIPALQIVTQADPKLTDNFLLKLRSIPYSALESDQEMAVAWAKSLGLIARANPLLAESVCASLLQLLDGIRWSIRSDVTENVDRSYAEVEVLVRALQQVASANHNIAERTFDALLGLVKDGRYADLRAILRRGPKGRDALTEALRQLLTLNQQRWGKAFQLLLSCNATECQEVRDALASIVLTVAEKQEKPEQFLINQLEGLQSPMGNDDADISAVYRQVIVGALARLLVLNRSNAKITEAELRQELQQLRSKEHRTHCRIAVWNVFVEAAKLREQENTKYNLLEYGR